MRKRLTIIEKEVEKLSARMGEVSEHDKQLLIKRTYGSCSYDDMYNRCYAIINQRYRGWQVLRYVRISRRGKRNPTYRVWEVLQAWNKIGCKQIIVGRARGIGWYLDNFISSSGMEIRRPYLGIGSWTNLPYSYVYNKSFVDAFGYVRSAVSKIDNIRLVYEYLCNDAHEEAFLRWNPSLFMLAHKYSKYVGEEYMPAYKVAMRHRYNVEDANSYLDYIDALVYLEKDIHNPYYVCPENFAEMHDKYIEKMHRRKEQIAMQQIAEQDKVANEKYQEMRSRFFDMIITNGKITCHVLQSVSEFYAEGKAMHNCVYQCGYYKKPYSVIFSARIDDKRVETVEFSLTDNKVVQAYGKCNRFSDYHKEVVDLVNANASLIQATNRQKHKLKLAV